MKNRLNNGKARVRPIPQWLKLFLWAAPVLSVAEATPLVGDDVILATVNETKVTAYDVDHIIKHRLKKHIKKDIDDDLRKTILESLVSSRAMAILAELEMDAGQLARLDKKIQLYREELLIKYYLDLNAAQEVVSEKMIKKYYFEHLEEFGQRFIKRFEIIKTLDSTRSGSQDYLQSQFERLDEVDDWKAFSAQLNESGYRVNYQQLDSSPDLFEAPLQKLLVDTPVEKTSEVVRIDGKLHRLRVTSEREIPAKPLDEVRAQIRQILSPLQLKKAVQQANKQALDNVTVNYLK